METLEAEWCRFVETLAPNADALTRGGLRLAFFSGVIALDGIMARACKLDDVEERRKQYLGLQDELQTFIHCTLAALERIGDE